MSDDITLDVDPENDPTEEELQAEETATDDEFVEWIRHQFLS